MTESPWFDWLAQTGLGVLMRDATWAFPIAEILHFLGLCALFGALLIVDLRVLGLGKAPMRSVLPFSRIAMAGLIVNTLTGIAFFCSDPPNYWDNPAFRWKLLLVVLGGLNALAFELLHRRGRLWSEEAVAPLAKAMAASSLLCWTAVIVLGRLLPYTGTGIG